MNVATFNASLVQVNNMLEAIDTAISDAYVIGIENYNRSTELSANTSELCTAANILEQVGKLHHINNNIILLLLGYSGQQNLIHQWHS